MAKWLPRSLLVVGVALAIWATIFPIHTAALQRARCFAYEQELRHSDVAISTNAIKYADTFAAAARTMSALSTVTMVTTAMLIIAGLVGIWTARPNTKRVPGSGLIF